MPQTYRVGDTDYQFPDDYTDEKVQGILSAQGIIKTGKKEKPGFWSQLGTQAKSFAGTLVSDIASAPGALVQAGSHPIDAVSGILKTQGKEFEEAKSSFKKGEYAHALRHGLGYLVPIAGPAASEAGAEMERGEYGKSLAHTAELSPLPETAAGKLFGLSKKLARPVAEAAAKSVYEAELKPGMKMSLAQRGEVVERGLKGELPIEKSSLDVLQKEIDSNRQHIVDLTKDPASPYSERSVPVADVLMPVDKWINRVARVDKRAAKALQRARDTWAESLGYEAPTAAKKVPTSILEPSGKPLTKTVAGTPGRAETTIAEAQQLKDDLYAVINSGAYAETAEPGTMTAGRKLAARGMKRGIEKSIPEEPIQAINHAIETDIRLKEAINSAVKRHPSWINDWAVFVLGAGVGEAIGAMVGGGAARGIGGGAGVAVGALTRMAARNPRIMSRLAIALNRSGIPTTGFIRGTSIAARTVAIGARERDNN